MKIVNEKKKWLGITLAVMMLWAGISFPSWAALEIGEEHPCVIPQGAQSFQKPVIHVPITVDSVFQEVIEVEDGTTPGKKEVIHTVKEDTQGNKAYESWQDKQTGKIEKELFYTYNTAGELLWVVEEVPGAELRIAYTVVGVAMLDVSPEWAGTNVLPSFDGTITGYERVVGVQNLSFDIGGGADDKAYTVISYDADKDFVFGWLLRGTVGDWKKVDKNEIMNLDPEQRYNWEQSGKLRKDGGDFYVWTLYKEWQFMEDADSGVTFKITDVRNDEGLVVYRRIEWEDEKGTHVEERFFGYFRDEATGKVNKVEERDGNNKLLATRFCDENELIVKKIDHKAQKEYSYIWSPAQEILYIVLGMPIEVEVYEKGVGETGTGRLTQKMTLSGNGIERIEFVDKGMAYSMNYTGTEVVVTESVKIESGEWVDVARRGFDRRSNELKWVEINYTHPVTHSIESKIVTNEGIDGQWLVTTVTGQMPGWVRYNVGDKVRQGQQAEVSSKQEQKGSGSQQGMSSVPPVRQQPPFYDFSSPGYELVPVAQIKEPSVKPSVIDKHKAKLDSWLQKQFESEKSKPGDLTVLLKLLGKEGVTNITWDELQGWVLEALDKASTPQGKAEIEYAVTNWLFDLIADNFSNPPNKMSNFILEDVFTPDEVERYYANCFGYSQLYKELGNMFRLDVGIVLVKRDVEGNAVGHACNIVKFSDGNWRLEDLSETYNRKRDVHHRHIVARVDGEEVHIVIDWNMPTRKGEQKGMCYYKDKEGNKLRKPIKELQIEGLSQRSIEARVHYNLGTLHLISGRYDKAQEEFQKAKEFNPNDADVHRNSAVVYHRKAIETKGPKKIEYLKFALQEYREAFRLNPYYEDKEILELTIEKIEAELSLNGVE